MPKRLPKETLLIHLVDFPVTINFVAFNVITSPYQTSDTSYNTQPTTDYPGGIGHIEVQVTEPETYNNRNKQKSSQGG